MAEAERCGAHILPVDSEHNGLPMLAGVERVWWQAGDQADAGALSHICHRIRRPFLETLEHLPNMTPQQAVRHPNWEMGQKYLLIAPRDE